MTTAAPSHDTLARMADDIGQLTRPIHTAVRGQIVSHDPLLDQLRAAGAPGGSIPGEHRRAVPTSRPAARLDPIGTLSDIYVAMAGWQAKLELPSPPEFRHGCLHTSCWRILLQRGGRGPVCSTASLTRTDWHKEVLRSFVGAAAGIAPSIADWLAADVHGWWHDAAVGSGWRPADLLKLR